VTIGWGSLGGPDRPPARSAPELPSTARSPLPDDRSKFAQPFDDLAGLVQRDRIPAGACQEHVALADRAAIATLDALLVAREDPLDLVFQI
jgi:hypothetical protein